MLDTLKPPQLPLIDWQRISRSEPLADLALLRLELLVGPSPLEDRRVIDFLGGPWDRTRKLAARANRLARLGLGVVDCYMRQNPETSWHDVANCAALLTQPDVPRTKRTRNSERAIETARGYLTRLETAVGVEPLQRVGDRFPRLRQIEHRLRELDARLSPNEPWPPSVVAELMSLVADRNEQHEKLTAQERMTSVPHDLTPAEIRALAQRRSFEDNSVRAWRADPEQLARGRNVDLKALRRDSRL